MLAAARAKAQAKAKAPAPNAGGRRPADIQYARLRAYVSELRKEGLEPLAKALVTNPGELPEVMFQLNEETPIQEQEPSAEMIESNLKVFKDGSTKIELLKCAPDFSKEELVGRCTQRDQEHILNGLTAYCNIIDMVTPMYESTKYSLVYEQYKILGGWATANNYDVCRLPPGAKFDREEQNRVVFALGKGSSVDKFVAKAGLKFFTDKISASIDKIYGEKNYPHKVAEVHVCFGFSPYVNYGYHTDATDLVSSVDLTYMLMLSPGRSSMRVAGAVNEAFYEHPGDMLYFDALNVYHRSGLACARTLKIAFFVKITKTGANTIDLTSGAGGASSSTQISANVAEVTVKVKTEKQTEEEAEEEEEHEEEEHEEAESSADAPDPHGDMAAVLHGMSAVQDAQTDEDAEKKNVPVVPGDVPPAQAAPQAAGQESAETSIDDASHASPKQVSSVKGGEEDAADEMETKKSASTAGGSTDELPNSTPPRSGERRTRADVKTAAQGGAAPDKKVKEEKIEPDEPKSAQRKKKKKKTN